VGVVQKLAALWAKQSAKHTDQSSKVPVQRPIVFSKVAFLISLWRKAKAWD
jgi:hypothetical protein